MSIKIDKLTVEQKCCQKRYIHSHIKALKRLRDSSQSPTAVLTPIERAGLAFALILVVGYPLSRPTLIPGIFKFVE